MDSKFYIKLCSDTFREIKAQTRAHENNKDLSLHQWLALITEEFMEMSQAINETEEITQTDKSHLGGMNNIRAEAVQMMALVVRMLEDHQNHK